MIGPILERLRIKTLPTLALVKDAKTKDYVVGFGELGNTDDFTTEVLEWRIAHADVIEYSGDLLVPPGQATKSKLKIKNKKTIRENEDDDSDWAATILQTHIPLIYSVFFASINFSFILIDESYV